MRKIMDFEILIDASFIDMCVDNTLTPIENKHVISVINDFEDGTWRYSKFLNFIWDNIADTALSYDERNALINQSHSLLTAAAQNLRLTDKEDDIGQGSELAEIVLYAFMKHKYNALPVVPKIFYKQNTQDNAKGADSVHIVINNNDFTLWFGEAKFYNSIEDARLTSIIASVKNSLRTDKLKKENSIISNINDLGELIKDDNLKHRIKSALSNKNSIDDLKPKINIPILLLHECNLTKEANQTNSKYKEKIISYHKERANSYFKKQINLLFSEIFKYEDIKFHIILFPVPSKNTIVSKFIKAVEYYKDV